MSASRNPVSVALNTTRIDGGLVLQVCDACAAVQYPPRELCRSCLADGLVWRAVDGAATLLACTELHNSLEPFFAARLPWHIASLHLDAGPVVFAHVRGCDVTGKARLRVANALDASGNWCLVAFDSDAAGAGEALDTTLRQLGLKP